MSMTISPPPRCLMPVTGMFSSDGGIAAVNRLALYALSEAGWDVDVMALSEKASSADMQYVSHGAVTYRTFGNNKLAFALAVWRALLQSRYDLVLTDHVNVASVLTLPRLVARVQYVVWLCGIEVFPPRPDLEGRLGLRHAWKRLAISEYTRSSVAVRFPDLAIQVCELALDPVRHNFVPIESELLSSRRRVTIEAVDGSLQALGERVILHVGRMAVSERYKGQDVLLRAMPHVLSRHPDAQLVLVGRGDDRGRLLAMAHDLPAKARTQVFMPGQVDDELLSRLYDACYVFAMPSTGEGFGLVYLEAMSRGKPCLGGQVDATPFVVRDGTTGLLVKNPQSVEQVTDGLASLLSDPKGASRMGQAGYELVQSYYLIEHFRERFWQALLS